MSFDVNLLRLTAERAAYRAGKIVREMQLRPLRVTSKGFRDIVTDADFASQKANAP